MAHKLMGYGAIFSVFCLHSIHSRSIICRSRGNSPLVLLIINRIFQSKCENVCCSDATYTTAAHMQQSEI